MSKRQLLPLRKTAKTIGKTWQPDNHLENHTLYKAIGYSLKIKSVHRLPLFIMLLIWKTNVLTFTSVPFCIWVFFSLCSPHSWREHVVVSKNKHLLKEVLHFPMKISFESHFLLMNYISVSFLRLFVRKIDVTQIMKILRVCVWENGWCYT